MIGVKGSPLRGKGWTSSEQLVDVFDRRNRLVARAVPAPEPPAREQAGGLLVNSDVFFTSRRDQLVALTALHALPLNLHCCGDEMSTDFPNASARSSSQVSQRVRLFRKRRRQGLRSVRILFNGCRPLHAGG